MKLENVIATTENCRYCLMCRHVCPIGHVTKLETLTPHGWGLTIASVRRGLLAWDEHTVDVLYSCADCGTCRAHCATDQPLPSAIATARAEVAAAGLAPAAARQVGERLARWGNPHQQRAPTPAAGAGEVALFVGDDARYLDPEGLEAALTLLGAVGLAPVLVGDGRNNGYLASSLGYPETAAALQTATLDEVRAVGARRVLVLSAGDRYALGQLRDERLGLAWPEGVTLEEVTAVLAAALDEDRLRLRPAPPGPPAAYVDPTHSPRVTDRYDAPRRLLRAALPGPLVELFWRRERAHPVGNTALLFTQPHLADHLAWARLGDARQRGAQRLVTEDAGTVAQLRRHAGRFGLQIQGLYPLLAESLA